MVVFFFHIWCCLYGLNVILVGWIYSFWIWLKLHLLQDAVNCEVLKKNQLELTHENKASPQLPAVSLGKTLLPLILCRDRQMVGSALGKDTLQLGHVRWKDLFISTLLYVCFLDVQMSWVQILPCWLTSGPENTVTLVRKPTAKLNEWTAKAKFAIMLILIFFFMWSLQLHTPEGTHIHHA